MVVGTPSSLAAALKRNCWSPSTLPVECRCRLPGRARVTVSGRVGAEGHRVLAEDACQGASAPVLSESTGKGLLKRMTIDAVPDAADLPIMGEVLARV